MAVPTATSSAHQDLVFPAGGLLCVCLFAALPGLGSLTDQGNSAFANIQTIPDILGWVCIIQCVCIIQVF